MSRRVVFLLHGLLQQCSRHLLPFGEETSDSAQNNQRPLASVIILQNKNITNSVSVAVNILRITAVFEV